MKHKGKRNKFFVSKDCHPQTIGVMETRANLLGIELIIDDPQVMLDGATDGEEFLSHGAVPRYLRRHRRLA